MKIRFEECDGCFAVHMNAETVHDAALITRFGMNSTSEVRTARAYVDRSGEFSASIVIGKHKRSNNDVPKRR